MIKFLIDENLDQRILRGLQLHVPNLPFAIVQETELAGAEDARLLQWAADNHYTLVTHDRRTMLQAARMRMNSGLATAGLVIVKKEAPLARVIEDLLLLIETCQEKSLDNQVIFIPL